MSPITTHVLDTARGGPADGVQVLLEGRTGPLTWRELARSTTGADGRTRDLIAGLQLEPGTYRMTFETAAYFEATGVRGFYPSVTVVFVIEDASQHYHVPLLLSPYGYSTYRGS